MRVDLLENIYIMKQPKLGEKISQLRKQKGLTQEELIEKCNISVRTIQRIESGEVTPRSYTLKTILHVLDYDLSQIQDEDDQSSSSDKSSETFKSNWFQESHEKYFVIIAPFLLFSFTYLTLSIFRIEDFFLKNLALFIMVTGFFSYFTFTFSAGYFERRKKHILEKQLENKEVVSVGYSLLKLLGVLIYYFALLTVFLLHFYFLNDQVLWDFSNLDWTAILLDVLMVKTSAYWLNKIITKVFIRKFGLVIDENGVTDNCSELSAGFVPWSDIKKIEVRSLLLNQKAIILVLKNPEEFVSKYESGSLKRRIGDASYKRFDSPIRLKTKYIDIRPSQLYLVLNSKLQEYIKNN
jgi:transcriptional regulator with XRE-family HTH domain